MRRTVIDVGASYGLFSSFIADLSKKNGNNNSIEVFAIEPIPSVASQIHTRTNLHVINKAIMPLHLIPPSGYLPLKVMKNSELSSFLEINPSINKNLWENHLSQLRLEVELNVPCTTLEQIIREFSIDKVDFIKIDTQGTDLEVLLSSGSEISKVMSCVLEFPYTKDSAIYSQEKEVNEAILYLNKIDFIPIRIMPNGSGECNVFFLNKKYSLEDYFQMENELKFSKAPTLKIGSHNALINMNLFQKLIFKLKSKVYKLLFNRKAHKNRRLTS
jgi:FkbM family methyltransferase